MNLPTTGEQEKERKLNNEKQNPVTYKQVSLVFGTILLTGLTSWFAFGHDKVSRSEVVEIVNQHTVTRDKGAITREEVQAMIQRDTPYVRDQQMLKSKLSYIEVAVKENTAVLTEIRVNVGKLSKDKP